MQCPKHKVKELSDHDRQPWKGFIFFLMLFWSPNSYHGMHKIQ